MSEFSNHKCWGGAGDDVEIQNEVLTFQWRQNRKSLKDVIRITVFSQVDLVEYHEM